MADTNRTLKHVVVLAATGNIGTPVVDALAKHPAGYSITAVTRKPTQTSFPPGVEVVQSDYSPASIRAIFAGKDAVVSCVPHTSLAMQSELIDVAIACGVARFIPSEFGMDTTHPDAPSIIPPLKPKIDTVNYLKQQQGKIGWTSIYNGCFFDWHFRFPAAMGYDVPNLRATIYDGGDIEFEVTTVTQIGNAVAAALAPEHQAETKNQHVFINSFTITQNKMIAELEKVTGKQFDLVHEKLDGFRERALQRTDVDPQELQLTVILVGISFAGPGALGLFSQDPRVGGLWNKRLGLEEEDFTATVKEVVDGYGMNKSMRFLQRS